MFLRKFSIHTNLDQNTSFFPNQPSFTFLTNIPTCFTPWLVFKIERILISNLEFQGIDKPSRGEMGNQLWQKLVLVEHPSYLLKLIFTSGETCKVETHFCLIVLRRKLLRCELETGDVR